MVNTSFRNVSKKLLKRFSNYYSRNSIFNSNISNIFFLILKKNCVNCFPTYYDIVNCFLNYYHNCLKEHLTEICHTESDTLTVAEIYAIFTFIRDYQ